MWAQMKTQRGNWKPTLRFLCWDGGVSVDQTSEDTTEGLDTERQRGNIQKQNIHNLASQNSTLNSSSNGDGLIGVDRLGGVTTENALNGLGNLRHTSHTTDEDNLLDVGSLETSIFKSLTGRFKGLLDQRVDESLKLGTGQLGVDVLGSRSIGSDERKVDIGLDCGGELHLRLLSSLTDTLNSHAVSREINAAVLLELLDEVADKDDIEVLPTKMGVSIGRLDLEYALLDLEDGNVESTTTKIEDSDDTVLILVETIGQRGSRRLVYHTENVQPSNLASILGSLTLRVVEISRNGDDSVLNRLVKICLGCLLHLVQNETSNLRRRILLAASLNPGIAVCMLHDLEGNLLDVLLDLGIGEFSPDQTLRGEECVFGIDDSLTLGGDTNKALAVLGESNY